MKFTNNTYYTIPNSSIYILILRVLNQDENDAKIHVAYISKQGHAMGLETIEVKKENTKHWEVVTNVPFNF